MTAWTLVECAARLLATEEREAVLGDLCESRESTWQALGGVVGLVARNEAAEWMNWRPWMAAFGLAMPASLVLMGASMAASAAVRGGAATMCYHLLLLLGWSVTAGVAAGLVSRRTLWASAALCLTPCIFCLSRFPGGPLPALCLFLFLPPALWGVWWSLRMVRARLGTALVLALVTTGFLIPEWARRGLWWHDLALLWPAWYVVAAAWLAKREEGL